ncbi:hypothetical protein OAD27_01270, partial [Amylibacter sp.]|nr:hypothetical protein [Amylibacter sp.]
FSSIIKLVFLVDKFIGLSLGAKMAVSSGSTWLTLVLFLRFDENAPLEKLDKKTANNKRYDDFNLCL